MILILVIPVIFENSNWTKYSSFVGQAYKSRADANKETQTKQELQGKQQSESGRPDRLEQVSCTDTDLIYLSASKNSQNSFNIYLAGEISFTNYNKINNKFIPFIQKEKDKCKDKIYLIEYSCNDYNSKVSTKISSTVFKSVKCEFGCNKELSACNTAGSCNNYIKDGDEENVDCGGKNCQACPEKQFCEDSDGLNYENKGFTTVEVDSNGKKEKMPIDDICKDEKILLEQACDVNGYVEKEYDCSAACVLGHSFKSINGNGGGGSLPVLFFIGDKKTIGSTEVTLESFTYPETCTFVFNDPEANILSVKIIIPKAGLGGGGYNFNKGENKITFTVIEAKQFSENRKCDGGKCISLDVCKDIKELISDSMTCIDKVLEPVENQVEEKCSKDWKYYACSEEKQTYIFYQCLLEKFPEFKDNLQVCAGEFICQDPDGTDTTVKGTVNTESLFTKTTVTGISTVDYGLGSGTDYCQDDKYIIESYCSDNTIFSQQIYECPVGTVCVDGACKEKSESECIWKQISGFENSESKLPEQIDHYLLKDNTLFISAIYGDSPKDKDKLFYFDENNKLNLMTDNFFRVTDYTGNYKDNLYFLTYYTPDIYSFNGIVINSLGFSKKFPQLATFDISSKDKNLYTVAALIKYDDTDNSLLSYTGTDWNIILDQLILNELFNLDKSEMTSLAIVKYEVISDKEIYVLIEYTHEGESIREILRYNGDTWQSLFLQEYIKSTNTDKYKPIPHDFEISKSNEVYVILSTYQDKYGYEKIPGNKKLFKYKNGIWNSINIADLNIYDVEIITKGDDIYIYNYDNSYYAYSTKIYYYDGLIISQLFEINVKSNMWKDSEDNIFLYIENDGIYLIEKQIVTKLDKIPAPNQEIPKGVIIGGKKNNVFTFYNTNYGFLPIKYLKCNA